MLPHESRVFEQLDLADELSGAKKPALPDRLVADAANQTFAGIISITSWNGLAALGARLAGLMSLGDGTRSATVNVYLPLVADVGIGQVPRHTLLQRVHSTPDVIGDVVVRLAVLALRDAW
jgi:hypothetical protein